MGDDAVVTHTAGLWLVRARGGEHVLKVQLNPDALRAPRFYELKQGLLAQAARAGLPVGRPVPTVDGADTAWVAGTTCELFPRYPAPVGARLTGQQVSSLVTTCLDLRSFLDQVPNQVVEELAPLPVPRLVEEPDWRRALDYALGTLLPAAHRRADEWGRFATTMLEDLAAAEDLLRTHDLPAWGEPPHRPSVAHADLHHHHFMVRAKNSADVVAVLDFDNLQVTDRLLDLAWAAELTMLDKGGPSAQHRGLVEFLEKARSRNLIEPDEQPLLATVLLTHSVPILVDIARDILERELLYPVWRSYVALLDPHRRLRLHRALTRTKLT